LVAQATRRMTNAPPDNSTVRRRVRRGIEWRYGTGVATTVMIRSLKSGSPGPTKPSS